MSRRRRGSSVIQLGVAAIAVLVLAACSRYPAPPASDSQPPTFSVIDVDPLHPASDPRLTPDSTGQNVLLAGRAAGGVALWRLTKGAGPPAWLGLADPSAGGMLTGPIDVSGPLWSGKSYGLLDTNPTGEATILLGAAGDPPVARTIFSTGRRPWLVPSLGFPPPLIVAAKDNPPGFEVQALTATGLQSVAVVPPLTADGSPATNGRLVVGPPTPYFAPAIYSYIDATGAAQQVLQMLMIGAYRDSSTSPGPKVVRIPVQPGAQLSGTPTALGDLIYYTASSRGDRPGRRHIWTREIPKDGYDPSRSPDPYLPTTHIDSGAGEAALPVPAGRGVAWLQSDRSGPSAVWHLMFESFGSGDTVQVSPKAVHRGPLCDVDPCQTPEALPSATDYDCHYALIAYMNDVDGPPRLQLARQLTGFCAARDTHA